MIQAIIVDDEMKFSNSLQEMIDEVFHDKLKVVARCKNVKEAVHAIKLHRPDLIFLDNNLPDGSGITYIPKFRELNLSCKIIIISAMTNLIEKAMAFGAEGFVNKPISFKNINMYI